MLNKLVRVIDANHKQDRVVAAICFLLCYVIGNTGLQPGALEAVRTRLIHKLDNPVIDNGELMILDSVRMCRFNIRELDFQTNVGDCLHLATLLLISRH